jgi:hypothetical protein
MIKPQVQGNDKEYFIHKKGIEVMIDFDREEIDFDREDWIIRFMEIWVNKR